MGSYVSEAKATAKVTLDGAEAGAQLRSLESTAKDLQKTLVDLYKAPVIDKTKIKETETALNEVEQTMKGINQQSISYQRVLSNLSGSSLKELQTAYKKLYAETKNLTDKSSEGYKKNLADLKLIDGEIKKVTSDMRSAGTATKTFKDTLKGVFAGILGANLVQNVIGGIVQGFKNALNTIKEFATGISQLKAITGASEDDLDYLKKKAMDLAAEYGKSAKEIVTAMKMVGSAKPELLENVSALTAVTEAVLTLAKASNMELSVATENLTTIMNQFGHGADQANKDINILAAGSKYGAVEVDYLGQAISKVGTVAKSAGLSLEQTTAAMELFGEKGIKAEIAGTGFKSVLVKLQADTKNYTNGIFDLNKAIDNNQSIAGDNIKLQEKFGKEFFNLAQILLQGKDRFSELTRQVTGTNVAFEQFDIATNNLQGDLDKAGGSWDKFVLGLDDGSGAITGVLRGVVNMFTSLLGTLDKINNGTTEEKFESWSKVLILLNPVLAVLNGQMAKLVHYWNKVFGEEKTGLSKKQIEDAKKLGVQRAIDKHNLAKQEAADKAAIALEIKQANEELTKAEQAELDKRARANEQAREKMLRDTETLNNQIRQMTIDLMRDQDEKKQAEIDFWYEKEQEKINISKAAAETRNEALLVLEGVYWDKLAQIYQKNIDDGVKKDEQAQTDLEKSLEEQTAINIAFDESANKQKEEKQDETTQKSNALWKKEWSEKTKKTTEGLKATQDVIGNFYDFMSSAREAELIAAGDNEEKKKEIMKKYADKEFILKASQIVASTAQAIIAAFAQLGPIAGGIAAGFIGATGIAQLVKSNTERERIKGLAGGGKITVTRAQDGRNFEAEYGGNGHGYYSKPTVLVAEEGPEFVVSNKALQVPAFRRAIMNIDAYQRGLKQLNYSGLSSAINNRLTGYADGGIIQTNQNQAVQQSNGVNELAMEFRAFRSEISTWANSLEVYVTLQKIRDAEATMSAIETEVRL
jgi:TP901 family phage tail tape measure protein